MYVCVCVGFKQKRKNNVDFTTTANQVGLLYACLMQFYGIAFKSSFLSIFSFRVIFIVNTTMIHNEKKKKMKILEELDLKGNGTNTK